MAFSNGISLVRGIFQRIDTFPVDFHWNFPMDVQWHFPMEFHFCDFWCVIVCPDRGACNTSARELMMLSWPPSRHSSKLRIMRTGCSNKWVFILHADPLLTSTVKCALLDRRLVQARLACKKEAAYARPSPPESFQLLLLSDSE